MRLSDSDSENSDVTTSSGSSDISSDEDILVFPEDSENGFDPASPGPANEELEGSESGSESEPEPEPEYLNLPQSLDDLRKKLLGDYMCTEEDSASAHIPKELTSSEKATLQHYIAWKKSNGTVQAYRLHAEVLEAISGIEILSLHSAQKLAIALTELSPAQIDMCPKSCLAYTGEFAESQTCPHIHNGKLCGEPRYKAKSRPSSQDKPRAQMMYLPIAATIKAMFANAETSKALRYRDQCLQQALHLIAKAPDAVKYSDFCDSKVHMHHYQDMHIFKDKRDIGFALSTDGAQLTMKKQSDTWLLILIVLNLPPEIRYKSNNVIYPLAIPGPNPPGNIESYLRPLFEDMAVASEGIWLWDALDSQYFTNRAYICMALGDMLGSAKLNGMAGHSAIYGDRFSMVKGAKSSLKKGSKAQYYPISSPDRVRYNPDRPEYSLENIPMRQEKVYWDTIENLEKASSKAARIAITRETGISRMPLCAASPAFLHPSFFPLDPFHLFYENCMAFIWDLWVSISPPDDIVHLPKEKAEKLGKFVAEAMSTLPPSFCGVVRDPFLKRQSQYKIYEWMALLHWYIIPIGIELGFNASVLLNFSQFAQAIEWAMTIAPRSKQDLNELHILIRRFLTGFQKLYVGADPEKISRFRLCIFQLIHVPIHIEWNGSIRLGSQSTVERAIGEVGHKIRSKKAPFANLANILFERQLARILLLYYPSLQYSATHSSDVSDKTHTLQKEMKILKREKNHRHDFYHHLEAICLWLNQHLDFELELERWGKLRISKGTVLRSRLSEQKGEGPSRSARYFEAIKLKDEDTIFGEALAFYEIIQYQQVVVVYHPIIQKQKQLTVWRGCWSQEIRVLPVKKITGLIGIWCNKRRVYILRKHPGLAWLSPEDLGNKEKHGTGPEEHDQNEEDL